MFASEIDANLANANDACAVIVDIANAIPTVTSVLRPAQVLQRVLKLQHALAQQQRRLLQRVRAQQRALVLQRAQGLQRVTVLPRAPKLRVRV